MTQHVTAGAPSGPVDGAAWIRRFAVRTPTLPPATHTNVWIVGDGELSVIDPASPWPEEQQALDRFLDELAAAGQRVVRILLTHHHTDHVSGAAHLARRLSVPVLAHSETARLVSGRVEISQTLADGDEVRSGDVVLRALFTPGHAPGHLAFLEPRAGALVAGDMVASVGTIVIDPPEGDMRLYLDSLERLRRLRARVILPAHGDPVTDPERLLSFYLAHRREREERVIDALLAGAATVRELVPRAYPDVPEAIWPLAGRSLLAHLYKLRDEGHALCDGDEASPDAVWSWLQAGCC